MVLFVAHDHISSLRHRQAFDWTKFARLGSLLTEMRKIRAIGSKNLYTRIARVGDQDEPVQVGCDTSWKPQLARFGTLFAETTQKVSVHIWEK